MRCSVDVNAVGSSGSVMAASIIAQSEGGKRNDTVSTGKVARSCGIVDFR